MDENRTFDLDRQIHDAYERVSLGDEAQERMLGALLAAQAQRQETEADAAPGTEAAPEALTEERPLAKTATVLAGGRRGAHAAPRSRRLPVWLPLAAVAACVFVVVGVIGGVSGGFASRTSETLTAGSAAKSADESEDAAVYATSLDEEQDAGVANDLALGATGEMLAAAPDAASEEAEDLQLVDLYPHIVLYDETSYTALVDGLYTTEVEAEAVGRLIGVGTASPFDADEGVACEVFELTDDDAYAVRYEGEDTYWYCTRL